MNRNGSDFTDHRKKIEKIDEGLLHLFVDRMALARDIAVLKSQNGAAVFDPQREDEIICMAKKQVGPEDANRAEMLMHSLMRLSRGAQYEMLMPDDKDFSLGRQITTSLHSLNHLQKAVYQGSAGSYADQACKRLFPGIHAKTAGTWEEACGQVVKGDADAAVLPLDNSTAGTVDDVYDLLLKNDLHIWRSLSLKIHHCLIGLPGSTLDGIRTVVSHPQAIAQCSDIIRSHGWTVRESLNTAFAAAAVAAGENPAVAAIASKEAAAINGLDILACGINNTHVNQTRFIAVGASSCITEDADRISLVLRLPHRSGSLAATLAIFGDRGLNLNKIQSRPDLENPWSYLFYLDFECPYQNRRPAMATLYQLSQEMPMIRFLGWYHEEVF